jgi:DNA (cytosine-5)-methyltransferase 1
LDLFAGAGGASHGYWLAGFDVIGVDIEYQAEYPYNFQWGDALTTGREILSYARENGIVAVHASPPCQHHTTLAKGNNANQHDYPDLIEATREMLIASGLPYIIENVPSAPLIDPITLCGEMFGLDVIRHRNFESNIPLTAPEHIKHRGRVAGMRHGQWFEGPYFAIYGNGGGKGTLRQWQAAMGIEWMSVKKSIAEAIPPVYSEYVGNQLMAHVKAHV